MKFITVTELKQKVTQIVAEIESNKTDVVITKNGKPVVLMHSISEKDFISDRERISLFDKKSQQIEKRMKELGYGPEPRDDISGKGNT